MCSDTNDNFLFYFFQQKLCMLEKMKYPCVRILPFLANLSNPYFFSYLAISYLKRGIRAQDAENKPLPSRYLFSYIKVVTTR